MNKTADESMVSPKSTLFATDKDPSELFTDRVQDAEKWLSVFRPDQPKEETYIRPGSHFYFFAGVDDMHLSLRDAYFPQLQYICATDKHVIWERNSLSYVRLKEFARCCVTVPELFFQVLITLESVFHGLHRGELRAVQNFAGLYVRVC